MTSFNPDSHNYSCCSCDNRTLTTPIASYVVENVSDLRAMTVTGLVKENEVAQTLGYYEAGDGGGNLFYWSPTEVTADDYGNIIKAADATTGRWVSISRDFNVRKFGAKGDGITDDAAALNRTAVALMGAAAGTMYIPTGTYRQSVGLDVLGIGLSIEGEGIDSVLLPDLSVTYSIKLGIAALNQYFKGRVSNLSISRAPGTLPGNTIGIYAAHYSYLSIEDVIVHRQDCGIKADYSNSLGLILNKVNVYDSIVHLWLKDVHEVFINQCNFGINGTESIAPNNLILFDGANDDIRIDATQFIPRVANTGAAFKWVNTPADSVGYYRLNDVNLEIISTAFRSDATALRIFDLEVTNSRITPTGKLFDFNAATSLVNISFINNRSISFATASSLVAPFKSNFSGNFVSGNLTVSGGGDIVVSGNTFTTSPVFTGAFAALAIGVNTLVFNSSSPITIDLAGATGNISQAGSVADAGTQPVSLLPGGAKLGSTGTSITRIKSQDVVINFASIAAGDYQEVSIAMTAAPNATILIGIPASGPLLNFTGFSDGGGAVYIRAFNPRSVAYDAPSATFKITAIEY